MPSDDLLDTDADRLDTDADRPGGPYAPRRVVDDLSDCEFYHTMDVPGYPDAGRGTVDLRPGIADYLGRVDVRGRRVLEIGTADGYVCFQMEAQGAEVVAYDLSEREALDAVPYDGVVTPEAVQARIEHVRKLNNAFWLCHRAFASRARMAYGTVYAIPEGIGPVDITTFGAVLIHLRDPFLALQSALRLTRETAIVTDTTLMRAFNPLRLAPRLVGPYALFLPDPRTRMPTNSWWLLTPALIRRMLAVLGFGRSRLRYHSVLHDGRRRRYYTIVAHRTSGAATQASPRPPLLE